jgi:hypothetical protein
MLANPTTLDKIASATLKNSCIVYYRGIECDMLALARENSIMMALPFAYYRVVRQYTQVSSTRPLYAPLFLTVFDSLNYWTALQ